MNKLAIKKAIKILNDFWQWQQSLSDEKFMSLQDAKGTKGLYDYYINNVLK